jgi:hypothetical protein
MFLQSVDVSFALSLGQHDKALDKYSLHTFHPDCRAPAVIIRVQMVLTCFIFVSRAARSDQCSEQTRVAERQRRIVPVFFSSLRLHSNLVSIAKYRDSLSLCTRPL